jgi:hypothetical protein
MCGRLKRRQEIGASYQVDRNVHGELSGQSLRNQFSRSSKAVSLQRETLVKSFQRNGDMSETGVARLYFRQRKSVGADKVVKG